jgi:hypothetical protein
VIHVNPVTKKRRSIGLVESKLGQVPGAWDAWWWQIGFATGSRKPENMLFSKTVITFRG